MSISTKFMKNISILFITILMVTFTLSGCSDVQTAKQSENATSSSDVTDDMNKSEKEEISDINNDDVVNSVNDESTDAQDEKVTEEVVEEAPVDDVNNEPKSEKFTHDDLLKMSNENYKNVLNQTYKMTLFLEQQPSGAQAEFMSQKDDGDINTILITCNMSSDDIAKLDGASAQNRIYKPYEISVVFKEYNEMVGLYYEADCELL